LLFKNRLEIWNPEHLLLGRTTEKLRQSHTLLPANPLLAEPMYLAGSIQRLGMATGDIIRLWNEMDLREPDFMPEEIFKTIIWQSVSEEHCASPQAGDRIKEEIKKVVSKAMDPIIYSGWKKWN
jgi:ATP-dependent DNA helicase RecG